jgi:hypothetical protein
MNQIDNGILIIKFLNDFLLPFLAWFSAIFGTTVIVYFYRQRTSSRTVLSNFPASLRGRESQIRSLADRILTGQSSALIGLFSNERTPILGFLRTEDPQLRERLYGDKANQLIFSYVDISLLDKDCTPAACWEKALTPLQDKIATLPPDAALKVAYQEGQAHQFKEAKLDTLMGLLDKGGWRLVLLLDWFEEEILQRPNLGGSSDFLRSVRTLAASRTPSPLVVITTSSMSLLQFHQKTQHLSPTGSPFLNFLEGGITMLGGLSEVEVDKLLEQSVPSLAKEARQVIKQMAGGHPYLLQVASSELQKASPQSGGEGLFERAEKQFYNRISPMLEEAVKTWAPRTCQAFLAVVQSRDANGFENELQGLAGQGFITKVGSQWQVRAGIFLKFVKDNPQLCNQP